MADHLWIIIAIGMTLLMSPTLFAAGGLLRGRAVDAQDGSPLPCRLYIEGEGGSFHLAKDPDGAPLVQYDNMDLGTGVEETYTLVGQRGFCAELPPGKYKVTLERGKEYIPANHEVEIKEGQTVELKLELKRLFDMASMGWYSADCHVHVPLEELAAAQLAEDVNVAFPITAWATHDRKIPGHKDGTPKRGEVVRIDDTHAYWNLNTEYEIFYVDDKMFVLGAFIILGHHKRFDDGVPPVAEIAKEAHEQGAVLDWEKPTWPWALMIAPVAGIDTIELSNNSMWRQYTIRAYLWERKLPSWIDTPLDAQGFLEYGFASYYMMLNGGMEMHPSAGTANGVHPVPLGHSRVYAYVEGDFSYEKWFKSYKQGRSFTTNGPMLLMKVDGHLPGDRVALKPGEKHRAVVEIETLSTHEIDAVELVVNSNVLRLDKQQAKNGRAQYRHEIEIDGSSWVTARCLSAVEENNALFAHTGAVWFDDPSQPLKPIRREVDYLIESMEQQIARCSNVLPPEALAEYDEALAVYRQWASVCDEERP